METLTAIFFILFRILHFALSHFPMWSRSSNFAVPLLSTWRRSNFAVPLSTWRPWRQCCHHCKIHNILHWKRSTQANGMNVHHLTAWPLVTGSLFAPTRMSRTHIAPHYIYTSISHSPVNCAVSQSVGRSLTPPAWPLGRADGMQLSINCRWANHEGKLWVDTCI